jgi:hypothetical protein
MITKKIVTQIDVSIKNKMALFCCMENTEFFGIAEPIVRSADSSEEWFPVVIDKSGEDRYVFIDDNFSIGIYHRIVDRVYIPVLNSYGDSPTLTVQTDMKLVCWGLINETLTNADQVERLIYSSLPAEITPTRSTFDRALVFGTEFRGIDFFVPEVAFLFSIDYYFKDTPARRDCVDLSDICTSI